VWISKCKQALSSKLGLEGGIKPRSLIGNVSITLPFRSAPTLNFSWSERNGNTERFMPTSSKLLAMCPSVCRSAPPRCSCYFTSSKNIRSLNLSWSERIGPAIQKDLCPQGSELLAMCPSLFLKHQYIFHCFPVFTVTTHRKPW